MRIKNTGNVKYSYKEKDHSRSLNGHDRLTDSRVIEATSLEEAQKIFHNEAMVVRYHTLLWNQRGHRLEEGTLEAIL
jgi:hypothetical protein